MAIPTSPAPIPAMTQLASPPPMAVPTGYHKLIPESEYFEFPGQICHYVMLAVATDEINKEAPVPFVDHPSVARQQVHSKVKELSAGFFSKTL